MIERDNPNLSITRQCWTLSISRSSFYYAAKGESEARAARRWRKPGSKDVGDSPNVLTLSEPLENVSSSWRKEEDSRIVIAHQSGISTHSFAPER